MKDYCIYCEKSTGTEFNAYMVGFCADCGQLKSRPNWTPVAYECHMCGRHDDETYPGQRVCDQCEATRGTNE